LLRANWNGTKETNVDSRGRATKWLIEHNHHACHLVDGQDGEIPKPDDADALAAEFRAAQESPELEKVIEAAREATCDTHNIPACVELGKALYEYDKARGALCPICDGAGSIDDDECDRGEGPTCTGPCGGTGLVEPAATRSAP
jgi:hypothetical protein